MKNRREAGFSLVELSVVLIIIGFLSAGIMATLDAVDSAKRTATENKLDEIEKALMSFREAHGRLPCPANDSLSSGAVTLFGREVEWPGGCGNNGTIYGDIWSINGGFDTMVEGALPVLTLNLPYEYTYDSWGRVISYSVMAAYTAHNAFDVIHPREQCGSPIYSDSSAGGSLRTSNAVYTLVSHGSNGHGGKLLSGNGVFVDTMNTGSVNTAELDNCRCDSNAADAAAFTGTVQKAYTQNPNNPRDTFDDIVRYKESWQFKLPDDSSTYAPYTEVQAVIGTFPFFTHAFYRKRCNSFLNTGFTRTAMLNDVSFVGLTPDNRYMFSYSNYQGVGNPLNCEMYLISGSGVTGASVSVPACPAWNATNAVSMSNGNGYLGITVGTNPFLQMWKYTGSSFQPLNFRFATAATAPASKPTILALSKNGDQMFVARPATPGQWAAVYSKSEDHTFTRLNALPGMPPANNIYAATYSRDGKYLAVSTIGCVPPLINCESFYIWKNTGPTSYTRITSASGTVAFSAIPHFPPIAAIAFSPDGQYLAIGRATPGDGQLPDIIRIYRINVDSVTDAHTYTLLAALNTFAGGYTATGGITAIAFTPDSNHILAIEGGTASNVNSIINIRKRNPEAFEYIGGTDNIGGYIPRVLGMYH